MSDRQNIGAFLALLVSMIVSIGACSSPKKEEGAPAAAAPTPSVASQVGNPTPCNSPVAQPTVAAGASTNGVASDPGSSTSLLLVETPTPTATPTTTPTGNGSPVATAISTPAASGPVNPCSAQTPGPTSDPNCDADPKFDYLTLMAKPKEEECKLAGKLVNRAPKDGTPAACYDVTIATDYTCTREGVVAEFKKAKNGDASAPAAAFIDEKLSKCYTIDQCGRNATGDAYVTFIKKTMDTPAGSTEKLPAIKTSNLQPK